MKKRGLFLVVLLVFSLFISVINAAELKVTSEHPFLLNGKWIPASELREGDILKTYEGKKVRITSIKDIKLQKPIKVYNLEAKPYHDFIVEQGLVVHNSVKQETLAYFQKLSPTEQRDYLEGLSASDLRNRNPRSPITTLRKYFRSILGFPDTPDQYLKMGGYNVRTGKFRLSIEYGHDFKNEIHLINRNNVIPESRKNILGLSILGEKSKPHVIAVTGSNVPKKHRWDAFMKFFDTTKKIFGSYEQLHPKVLRFTQKNGEQVFIWLDTVDLELRHVPSQEALEIITHLLP